MEKRQAFEGKLKFLDSRNDKLQPVELWCLNGKTNRNNWQYQNISAHLSDFLNIPILTAYLLGGKIISDGHNYDIRRDENGEEYASFTSADAERIVGWIDDDASVRIQKDDEGIDWVVCRGNLWSFYCHELVQKLKGQGLEGMSISIETLVFSEDIIDGVAYEKDYTVLGVTILNESVAPAVENASIRTLSHLAEIRNGMKKEILKAASYIEGKTSETVQGKNNLNERMRFNMTYFSRKQCAELTKRFDGYTVIAAAQDDNGIHVALLSDNGDIAKYEMNSVDETIAVERIKACEATVTFDCDNGEDCEGLHVELSETLAVMSEVVTRANEARDTAVAELQRANESLTAAMGTITDMRNAENARRVQSAKAAAKKTLSAFNATSEFEISESVLEAVNSDIDNGVYTERVNSEGAWTGDAEVTQRVMAICAGEQQKHNQAKSEKNKSTYIWEMLNSQEDDGSVAALLKKKGIRD